VADLIVTFPCLQVAQPTERELALVEIADRTGAARATPPIQEATEDVPVDGRENGESVIRAVLQDVPLRSGTTVRVPLVLRGTGDVYAAQFTLRPDTESLRIVEIERGPMAEGAMFAALVDEEGIAHIAMASAQRLEIGTVTILQVEVLADPAASKELAIEFLEAIVNAEDILAMSVGARALIDVAEGASLPAEFALLQNQPNPFRPGTTIRFLIPAVPEGEVFTDLSIYGVDGRRIRSLVSNPLAPGE
jgi:hypothetical protein